MDKKAYGLLLDLSSPVGTFSIFKGLQQPICVLEKELPGSNSHSESFLTELEKTLVGLGLRIDDLSPLVVSRGPGSFTGLRIAFATLKAFAWSGKKSLITLDGPEARAMAFQKKHQPQETSLAVLTYLTADKYVASQFKLSGGRVEKISEDILSQELPVPATTWVLTEERIPSHFVKGHLKKAVVFPLRSSHLIHFLEASTRKEISQEELFALSPLYFGSTHFD